MSADEPGATAPDVAELFDRHHEPLHRYVARLTGDVDAAADVAQEAFVRLLDQPTPPRNPRPWLFRVATNLVRQNARSVRRRERLGHDGRVQGAHGDPPRSPEFLAERQLARRRVMAALEGLTSKERQALLMREEGFKHREIADALGTTTGSVGTLLRRAVEKAARGLRNGEDES